LRLFISEVRDIKTELRDLKTELRDIKLQLRAIGCYSQNCEI